MAGWRTVRVFISSTFRDMQAERDHLVKVVFPTLRERLEKHHIYLIDIDLRWGVTREQAENDQVIDLCLAQAGESEVFVGILGQRYGYARPTGGFCVWLDVSAHGGDEAATVKLYRDGGVRVVPGSYLARQQPDGSNPGAGYIRLALVQDSETTAEALHRLVKILD